MKNNQISTIVIGDIATDIIAYGVDKISGVGESERGELKIAPGGKAVNISRMIAALNESKNIAILGINSKDPYNLWTLPLNSLKESGINTNYVQLVSFEKSNKFAHTTIIVADKNGNHQIYGLRGINDDFSPSDIDRAAPLFESAEINNGIVVATLVMPYKTVLHAVRTANKHNLKVLLEMGGVDENLDYTKLFKEKIFLIKPNEYEAKKLTGIEVRDFNTAKKAASTLLRNNIDNVLITHGEHGGYLFNKSLGIHLPSPAIKTNSAKDAIGCGDQTIAALAAALINNKNVLEAAKIGILAGTLQFGKNGIVPITKKELEKYR
ncbi:MAG TPA: PfkB family carbohydrate kinase [Candidatus Limnocylindrales bacterium]|nr:PfkB family carbohydrate kinase [Candidatus Limnocylindrales bacterium]